MITELNELPLSEVESDNYDLISRKDLGRLVAGKIGES